MMRKAVAFRFDVDLLDEARTCARLDNRTLTNFVATAIQARIAAVRAERSGVTGTGLPPAIQPPTEPTDEPLHT